MSNIFKLCYTTELLVKRIYVFIGSRIKLLSSDYEISELDNLYKSSPTNQIFDDIFSLQEQQYIADNNVDIIFCNEQIHLDDTIETIKKKLLKELYAGDILTSYEELYMFYKTTQPFNPEHIYQNLTQNKKIELTKERLIQFLLNIDTIDTIDTTEQIKKTQVKDIYDYNDFLEIISSFTKKTPDVDNNNYVSTAPIGQKFTAIEGTYPFTVNPFNILQFDKFLEKHATDLTTTTNQSLLMDSEHILNNVIYFCIASEVLESIRKIELSQDSCIKI